MTLSKARTNAKRAETAAMLTLYNRRRDYMEGLMMVRALRDKMADAQRNADDKRLVYEALKAVDG